jgi:hypothetical protein
MHAMAVLAGFVIRARSRASVTAQCSTCQRNTGWVAPAGISQAPSLPKFQPTKLVGSLICAVVRPFDAGRFPALFVCPVVSVFQ